MIYNATLSNQYLVGGWLTTSEQYDYESSVGMMMTFWTEWKK